MAHGVKRLTANAKIANSPEFNPSILRHNEIRVVADEALLNKLS
jgi:hypothetical protein